MLEITDGDLELRRHTLETPPGQAPRDLLQLPIQFGEDDGIGFVEQRLEEATGPDESLDEKLVVADLHGSETTVTQRDVYELIDSRGAAVVQVRDKRRASVDIEFEAGETDVADIESLVDETVSELNLEPASVRVEQLVRATDSTGNSSVRDEVDAILEDERASKFDEVADAQSGGDA